MNSSASGAKNWTPTPDHLHGQCFDVPFLSVGLLEYFTQIHMWATNIISNLENYLNCL